ncbi:GntR family transcriptional regulator [Aestuariirhabdus sp. Z084]|uniref:GntR family transcriptional regulator n=1 Tax=Aestuariirhabdus haliotis TaxID=2918751 RepID=UPI00201B4164|nr:GntR family transcriptional regulator [Aestuariirhabdus haliotis]MCL6416823.1 GntR family transcriptional regulator [Aestuariirhabdus haliotis]MCL6420823.1 GntR family transcriptional regulator [Aestuariirhabdus haliotis]
MNKKAGTVYKTRTQMVVDVLRDKILSGEIVAGEPLRQDALAKEFNVSRIPVREALLQLEAQGLVFFEPHKGATATELSATEIHELFDLRALIECRVLEAAIDNMTDDDLRVANKVLRAFEEAVESGVNIETWSELNYELHAALYQPANMPQAMEIIRSLNTKSDRYIRLQLLLTTGIAKAEREHSELFSLCESRDRAAASALLKKHILEAGQAIYELLEQQKSKGDTE